MSIGLRGDQSKGPSTSASLSADGRFIVFVSGAPNLVPNDGNGVEDVFVRNRSASALERASMSSTGAEADGRCTQARVSADGRFVVFWSIASTLVPLDKNDDPGLRWDGGDIFVRDRAQQTTERVSVTPSGAELQAVFACPSISDDGRFVAFTSDADLINGVPGNGSPDNPLCVWVKDRATGGVIKASVDSNGTALPFPRFPVISGNGHVVAFRALTVLFPGFAAREIYTRDLAANTTEIVSVGANNEPGNFDADQMPSISADGNFVAFQSFAMNLVPGDSNVYNDVFVRDRAAHTTERVSVSSTGAQGFESSSMPVISANGRFVAFFSAVNNLVTDDTNGHADTFLRDRLTESTVRVSVPGNGAQPDGDSLPMGVSGDGTTVLVVSYASNLVEGDTNGDFDVYACDRSSNTPAAYCTAKTDSIGCTPVISSSGMPSYSGSDAFQVRATNLRNNRRGRLFYSLCPSSLPFQGGIACIDSPLRATPTVFSGGNRPGPDCSGVLQFDFNAWIRGGTDFDLVPGTTVYTQFRYHDQGHASLEFALGLSDALVFTIAP